MSKRKQRGLKSTNTSGYRGVIQRGHRFRAEITINRQRQYVGTFDTAKEAAWAYDCCAKKNQGFRSRLNFPDGIKTTDADYKKIMYPNKKKRRLRSTNTTGYTGVCFRGKRFKAQLRVEDTVKNLGTFDTKKEAALAFDKAVIQYGRPKSLLNFNADGVSEDESERAEEENGDDTVNVSAEQTSSIDEDGFPVVLH